MIRDDMRVDKSAESIARQVNALLCSSLRYRLRVWIGYFELTLKK